MAVKQLYSYTQWFISKRLIKDLSNVLLNIFWTELTPIPNGQQTVSAELGMTVSYWHTKFSSMFMKVTELKPFTLI